MSAYLVQKRFEQFHPGDELTLNHRQAKYLLMSGHIVSIEQVMAVKTEEAEIRFIKEPELELEPRPEEQVEETDASAAGKKKAKS